MKDIISKRRKELGMTQQELADKLFISDKVVSKWETGKSVPDTSILVELANALEISLDELLKTSSDNQVKIKESSTLMVRSRFNILLIIFFTIEILSSLLLILGCLISDEREYEHWSIALIVCGFVFELFALAFFFIRYNQLRYKYPKISIIRPKYFNLAIWFTCLLLFIVTSIFIKWSHQEQEVYGPVFISAAIYLAIGFILTLINMKKKKTN